MGSPRYWILGVTFVLTIVVVLYISTAENDTGAPLVVHKAVDLSLLAGIPPPKSATVGLVNTTSHPSPLSRAEPHVVAEKLQASNEPTTALAVDNKGGPHLGTLAGNELTIVENADFDRPSLVEVVDASKVSTTRLSSNPVTKMDEILAMHANYTTISSIRGGKKVPRKTVLRNAPRPASYPLPPRTEQYTDEGRYLFVCPNYGRTNNQVVSLAKAYTLAYYSRRTLVMTRWWHKAHGTDRKKGSVCKYFNFTGGPVRIITREEFGVLRATWNDSFCGGLDRLDTCIHGEKIQCAHTTRLSEQNPFINVKLLSGPVELVALDGINSFFANVPQWPCIWSYVQIPQEYGEEVSRWTKAVGLSPGYLSLHLRFLENKCIRFAKKHIEGFRTLGMPAPDLVRDVAPMCLMDKAYYSRWRNESAGNFYVAHDFQFDRSTMHRLTADGARYYFGPIGGDERLIIDFWLSVEAGAFVGNAMSTMSLNICAARKALQKSCDNLDYIFKIYPCHPHPDFDKGFSPAVPEGHLLRPKPSPSVASTSQP